MGNEDWGGGGGGKQSSGPLQDEREKHEIRICLFLLLVIPH